MTPEEPTTPPLHSDQKPEQPSNVGAMSTAPGEAMSAEGKKQLEESIINALQPIAKVLRNHLFNEFTHS